MDTLLIRVLPACLTNPLPVGWNEAPAGYVIEVMDTVERPEVVQLSVKMTEPDILLIDSDFPDFDTFQLIEQVIEEHAGLAVVVVSENSSPERLRRAMHAGAEEYLTRPLEGGSLRDSIMAIAGNRELRTIDAEPGVGQVEAEPGIVVGILSGKGGLGKTTLAVNMAALVAKAPGKKGSMVGLESGDGAVLLSINPKLGLMDMAGAENEATTDSVEWLHQFGTSHKSGLMYYSWQGSATQGGGHIPDDFFQTVFDTLRQSCAVTLVDFPLLSADEAGGVLPLLDIIIVVSSTSDLLALRSTRTFLDMVPEDLRQRVRIVINRAEASDMISRDDFEQTLGHKVAAVLPNDPAIAAAAINMGTPFVLTQPDSELAKTVQTLAQHLFKLPVDDGDAKPKRRFKFF